MLTASRKGSFIDGLSHNSFYAVLIDEMQMKLTDFKTIKCEILDFYEKCQVETIESYFFKNFFPPCKETLS